MAVQGYEEVGEGVSNTLIISDDEFLEWYTEVCDVCEKYALYFSPTECGNGLEVKLGERWFDNVVVDFDGVLGCVFLDPIHRRYYFIRHEDKQQRGEWREL